MGEGDSFLMPHAKSLPFVKVRCSCVNYVITSVGVIFVTAMTYTLVQLYNKDLWLGTLYSESLPTQNQVQGKTLERDPEKQNCIQLVSIFFITYFHIFQMAGIEFILLLQSVGEMDTIEENNTEDKSKGHLNYYLFLSVRKPKS